MSAGLIAIGAAVSAVIAWGLKALAIWMAGGLDQSPLEGPLFFLGLISIVVSFVALGAFVTARRPTWQRLIAAVVTTLVGLVLFLVIEEFVGGLVPASAGWVQEEAGLWAASLLALLLVFFVVRKRVESATASR